MPCRPGPCGGPANPSSQTPDELVPKVFRKFGARYADRPGGYTRVLRIEPLKEDQAASAILELVDGPKDMRFAMTAKTLAALPENKYMNEITARNVEKVTKFRKDGMEDLRKMIDKMKIVNKEWDGAIPEKRRVYPHSNNFRRKDMEYPDVYGE